jgi:hypothetical protein
LDALAVSVPLRPEILSLNWISKRVKDWGSATRGALSPADFTRSLLGG